MPDKTTSNVVSDNPRAIPDKSENVVRHEARVTKEMHTALKGQKPCILWFTGLSGSGKSTTANALELRLFDMGYHTHLLDGDNVRHGLSRDLGFGEADRVENIRRVGEVSKLFVEAGLLVLTAFISPFRSDRRMVRDLMEEGEFIEIFVDTPLEVCEQRDPKGLYKRARKGEIANFTGISAPYEAPEKPEIRIDTRDCTPEEAAERIVEKLEAFGILANDGKAR